ncbi:short-chain dehydrogenase [Mycobacterium sp. ACS1612]|nr:SDR family oxidoreductase [Mycobacterium sp. ACS1612]OBF26713.1 short-chain dehydrogenase [Mycobacterium sp. ACS1612]
MDIRSSVAFVTGANRGLGLAFARALRARGVRRVYAGMRNPEPFDDPSIVPVRLDVTDPDTVDSAAEKCGDVTLLVNNAGIGVVNQGALDPSFVDVARRMFETNFYGMVHTSQAFAPVIVGNGGGAIINVLSDATWFARPLVSAYSTTKSAAWNFTNALRLALRDRGVLVTALHVGFVDTDMAGAIDTKKSDPRVVAETALEGVGNDQEEVLADEQSRRVKSTLSAAGYYLSPPQIG